MDDAKDELYDSLRGPAQNLTILATAYSDPEQVAQDVTSRSCSRFAIEKAECSKPLSGTTPKP